MHIGCNRSDGMLAPIFGDGSFKYVPIREYCPSNDSWTYAQLGAKDWVPEDWKYAHYDPEFLTFTWGDYAKIRTHWARKLRPGDYYFFISSLRYHQTEARREPHIDPEWGYYLIGLFEAQEAPVELSYPIPSNLKSRFKNNAHVRRVPKSDEKFLIFSGTARSCLLKRAVPLSRRQYPNELAKRALPWASASNPRWWQGIVSEEGASILLNEVTVSQSEFSRDRRSCKNVRTVSNQTDRVSSTVP